MTQRNPQPTPTVDVAIIGAGPYGLSLAAHLAAQGVTFRIFGHPMTSWAHHMPRKMRLKSEGFASSLSDPEGKFTLGEYCRLHNLPYADTGLPVPLESFVAYGLEFQKRFVPTLETAQVIEIRPDGRAFALLLNTGEQVVAAKVVVAVGISLFSQIPQQLMTVPDKYVTHSSAHRDVRIFRDRDVAVVGAGASALDLAAELVQAGARVQLIARAAKIRFHDPPQPRSMRDRFLQPMTGLGPGLKLLFCAKAPLLFRWLPPQRRIDIVGRLLGPAAGWFLKEEVTGKVSFHLGMAITNASLRDERVVLELCDETNNRRSIEADHVIAATGYRVNVDQISFLAEDIRNRIELTGQSPKLSSRFESSVSGLYFIGVAAANTFGPLMRFVYGADFAARRLSGHLARLSYRKTISDSTPEQVRVLEQV